MVPLAIKKKKTFVAKEVRLAQRTYTVVLGKGFLK